MKNKNTVRKTQSAGKQFTTWLQMSPRFETREINKIPPGELVFYAFYQVFTCKIVVYNHTFYI